MAYKHARIWPLKSDNYNWLFSHAIIHRGKELFSASSALKHGQHNRQNSNGIQIWSDLPDAPHHIITQEHKVWTTQIFADSSEAHETRLDCWRGKIGHHCIRQTGSVH